MRVKFNSLFENILLETHYDTKAAEQLAASGLFDLETSKKTIQDLFRNKIHAFTNCKSWLEKYLKGIVRMLIDESNGDQRKATQFLSDCISEFEQYFTYAREYRPKLETDKERLAFDDKFVNQMSYQDVKDFNEKYQKELDKQSKDELSKMNFTSSNYELVPINSYEEMHDKFGGNLTGNGKSNGYAGDGNGGTAWCHTNDRNVYQSWINRGDGNNRFFVLMNKNFKDIPFNPKTNSEKSGKDDYGNSLIAILVDKYGNLNKATLRCNHVGVDSNADNQYKTYAELSKIVGFNVEDKVNELGDFEENPIKDGVYYYDGKPVSENLVNLIRAVIVKDDVTEIGDYAFKGCGSLKSITIPDSVTKIGESAFRCCTSLKSITIPNSVTEIGDYAFKDCESLKSITIPNSVTEIGEGTFKGCVSLKSITIPNSVIIIGDDSFSRCTSLESITIPDSVTQIGWYAFATCTSLKSITISNSVTKINVDAFDSCISLESITIPDSVTTIAGSAFRCCASLKSITIPNSVTEIGDYAFKGCGLLKSITIPDSVTKIEESAFRCCASLESITIPDSVTKIEESAFKDCESLKSITISNSVTKINADAFDSCISLESITIPDSVTQIGWYAFYNCKSLQSIIIPDSVTYIGNLAFCDCPNLTVYCNEDSYAYEYCIDNNIKVSTY